MGNKKEKRRIIYEATERGFVIGAIHSGIGGDGSGRFEITEPLHFAGWHLYGGESGCIYNGGRWAKIITPARKPLFVTEDGIETFDGEKYWFVNKNSKDPIVLSSVAQSFDLVDSSIRFSTLKSAQDWIVKQKQKQKEAELIKEAEKRGFDKYPHKWDDINEVRPPESEFRYTEKWLMDGTSALSLKRSGKVIWRSDKGWATVITEPKSLKPEELVEGEIYFADVVPITDNGVIPVSSVFRYKGANFNALGYFQNDDTEWIIRNRPIRPATLLEKQKLVKAEVNNGFFYKL